MSPENSLSIIVCGIAFTMIFGALTLWRNNAPKGALAMTLVAVGMLGTVCTSLWI